VSTSQQSAGRRLGVATIDQAISGASNILIAVLAARVLSTESFGLFGIVMLIYVLALGSARALAGEPLLLHPMEAERRPGDVVGTAAILGLGVGAMVVVTGFCALVWDGRLGHGLIALGIFLPLMIVLDVGRYLGFATRRPGRALTLDTAWLVLQVGAVALLATTDVHSLWQFVTAWAASGAAAGLGVFWQHRRARPRWSLDWLSETWPYSWRYLVSYSSTQGSALAAAVLLGAISGARALGAVQGALLLQRPFMTFQVAGIASGVGEVSRTADDLRKVRQLVGRLTVLTSVVAILNGAFLLALPEALGRALLGETWLASQDLLLPAAVQILLIGLMTGLRTGVLGLRAVHKAVKIDIVTTVLILVLTVAGALVGGARAAMWGVALSHAVGATIWWTVFMLHTRGSGARFSGTSAVPH
jgi:O-antigen/teichoic acid export membrane protein